MRWRRSVIVAIVVVTTMTVGAAVVAGSIIQPRLSLAESGARSTTMRHHLVQM
jgi:hypothetical protein